MKNIALVDMVTNEDIQEVGEDLSAEMGRVLETKNLIID